MTATENVRYPFRAKLGVALAALAVLLEIGALGVFVMPLIPLVPVFFLVILGNAFVLADVVQWAASLGRLEPVKDPRAEAAARPQRISHQEAARAT
jgi:hypothetical protein